MMPTPKSGTNTSVGMPVSIFADSPMPARSAAMLKTLGEEQKARGVEERARVMVPQRACQATAGHEADPRADELDRGHQREGRERGPEHAVAERGAGHRVRRDPARIVVRRAGHEARAEQPEVADERVVAVGISLLGLDHRNCFIMPRSTRGTIAKPQ